MSDVVSFLGPLLTIGLMALALSLVLSPFESLKWWAGWVEGKPAVNAPGADAPGPSRRAAYIVFLPGVGTLGDQIDPWERGLVERLSTSLPDAAILADVFPFSPTNRALIDPHRRRAWWWQALATMREQHPNLLAHLIDWRNLTQVFVSLDGRYGPVYNSGVADHIIADLRGAGYVADSGTPITIIGYSGGGQIALGVTPYVHLALGAPVTVIALGGVEGSDPGLDFVEHLYHLYGTIDMEQRMRLIFPSCWPMMKGSRWNRALAAGTLTFICLGEMTHCAERGYLDP